MSVNVKDIKVEHRQPKSLKKHTSNARVHTAEQIEQLKSSIQQWGWTQPILIDEQDTVLAGHGRLEAAIQLGLKDVPVVVSKGWSESQKKAYVIADNQLALNSEWDNDLLMTALNELSLEGFDIDLIGFSDIDTGVFTPNLSPQMNGVGVTEDDIEDMQDELNGEYREKSKQEIVEVMCPHCGKAFGLNKDAI